MGQAEFLKEKKKPHKLPNKLNLVFSTNRKEILRLSSQLNFIPKSHLVQYFILLEFT